ncbi:MAG: phosphonate ABC transporter ATP-binding protein, partial [Alphaproteobacteria bacterium]
MASVAVEAFDTRTGEAGAEHAGRVSFPRPVDLSIHGLAKSYGSGVRVFEDVGFTVRRGEAVALIGANGAGKSTLLRCCVGLIPASAGEVDLLGREVTGCKAAELRRLRSQIGFVFQRHNLVPRLSALSNVVHGALGRARTPRLWHQAFAPAALRDEALAALALVGLEDVALRRADRLSGGQSQRVAIARAMMQRPRFIMADEPVASLDPAAGEEVMDLFVRLIRAQRLTLLFTSHNLDHAVRYADRVVALRQGRIALDASADSLDVGVLRRLYVACCG